MNECIIPMKSPTAAKKAQRLLAADGIRSSVVGVDPSVTRHGCSYGLSLYCQSGARACRLLQRRGIEFGDLIGGGANDISR